MRRIQERKIRGLSGAIAVAMGVVLLALAASPAAVARSWKPTPQALAIDYTQIIHQRTPRDLVILIWLVPQTLGVASEETRELLDKYALIGIAHGHMLIGGTMGYDSIRELNATDDRGIALVHLSGDDIPPMAQGALATVQAVFKKMIGPMGEGIQWFVFEAGAVHACEKGGLSIAYDGETYSWETPIPGCSAK
jgi:hypothetical protein